MSENKVIIHHIRNATNPEFDQAPTVEQKKQRVPMVDLPIPMDQILKNLDAVIITHIHIDHWDECAAKAIPKYITIFVQNASDKKVVAEQGFQDIRVVGVNDEEGKYPSVEDSFKENKIYDFYEFIQDCDDLAQSQNGYFNVDDTNGINFKMEFMTFDDTDDMEGTRTGFVLFEVLIKPTKESLFTFQQFRHIC